jgi:hypothetical protein
MTFPWPRVWACDTQDGNLTMAEPRPQARRLLLEVALPR